MLSGVIAARRTQLSQCMLPLAESASGQKQQMESCTRAAHSLHALPLLLLLHMEAESCPPRSKPSSPPIVSINARSSQSSAAAEAAAAAAAAGMESASTGQMFRPST
jgi:hypothetical protein